MYRYFGSTTLVTDISPLSNVPLQTLDLSHCNRITDFSPLRNMRLKSLNLSCTRVSDLTFLKGTPLEVLHIGVTAVTDLSPLRGLPLHVFTCGGNPAYGGGGAINISDLSPLSCMPLETIDIGGCKRIKELSFLKGMKLTSLCCYGTAVDDFSCLKGMTTLVRMPFTDPWSLVSKPLIRAVQEKNAQAAETEAKKLVADLCDVPAFAAVVQKAKSPYLDLVIPLLKNPNEIPPTAKAFNGHHYCLWPSPMSWPDAKKFCESVGGHLVTIADDAENALVVGLFRGATQETGCHIGLTKDATGLQWVTGEPVEPTVANRFKLQQGNLSGMWVVSGDANYKAKPGDWYLSGELGRPFVIEWDR